MRRTRRLRRLLGAAALLAATLAAGRARAGGFEIYDQSPVGTAMAGAVSAKADDPSAIFYNPAGIALRPGGGAQLGGAAAFASFQNRSLDAVPVTTATTGGPALLPQVYAATHLGARVAVGVGLFAQFGAGARWATDGERVDASGTTGAPFPGRFVARNTQLQTVTINPTLAVRPTDRIAFGIGLDIVLASFELERAVQFADVEGAARLGGSARGFGCNLGVLVDVVPRRMSAALTYRSAVALAFDDLRVHFTSPPELKDQVYDQPARTAFSLPHNLTFGLAFFPTDGLTLTTDVHLTLWSDFRSLSIAFPSSSLPALEAPQSWRDSWSARVGGEYLRALGPGRAALRLGVGYDLTPIPAATLSPSVPTSDLLLLSAGLGYSFRNFSLDAGYLYAHSLARSSTLPAYPSLYHASLAILSVSLSYRWR